MLKAEWDDDALVGELGAMTACAPDQEDDVAAMLARTVQAKADALGRRLAGFRRETNHVDGVFYVAVFGVHTR